MTVTTKHWVLLHLLQFPSIVMLRS